MKPDFLFYGGSQSLRGRANRLPLWQHAENSIANKYMVVYFCIFIVFYYLGFIFEWRLLFFIYFFIHVTFWKDQKVTKKSLLLKKLNGSILNQFATCSACGTRLLRKLKHPRLLLQVPFYFKFSPVFWKSRFAQIRTLGKLL